MEGQLHLLVEYRYWILIPLTFLEGPIVAFFAGTLASLGYFNIFVLAIFFFARDIIVDGLCYWLGYVGYRARWGKWLLTKVRVEEAHIEDVRRLWGKHPGKTLFFSKLSYGVAAAFIVVAGMVEVPLRVFFGYGAVIALLHYGVLLVVGYFFGTTLGGEISSVLERLPYIITGIGIFAIAYFYFKRSMGKKLQEAEKAAEREHE